MKIFTKIILGCLAIFMSTTVIAEPQPFNAETHRRFKKVEVKQVMRFLLNNASLFPSGDTLSLTDQFGNPAVIPAGSDILHAYFYVKTAFTTSTQTKATLAVSCGGATLLSATDESGVAAGNLFDGSPAYNYTYAGSGAANGYVGSSQCVVTATQASGVFSAGKIYGYAEYVNVLP